MGFEEAVVAHHVGPGVEDDAVGGQAVAACASDLLVPGLDALRHVAVDHEPHVALVDPHAERDGRHHHVHLVARERVLVALAQLVGEPGVIGHRAHAMGAQPLGEVVHGAPAQAVDDPALARVPADDAEDVAARVALRALALRALALRGDHQVGAEERALEPGRLPHLELTQDVADHAPGGGRGQRQDRQGAELALESLELAVGGTEIVPPMADAVRLVHHHQAHLAAGDQPAQRALERLGRHVEQLDLAAAQRGDPLAALLELEGRVDQRGAEAEPGESVHLVLHQRDQGRDHQHRPGQQLGRDLEGERLAGPGGHHPDAVAAGEHGVDDLALPGAELRVAEHGFEHLLGGVVLEAVEQRGLRGEEVGHGPSMDGSGGRATLPAAPERLQPEPGRADT